MQIESDTTYGTDGWPASAERGTMQRVKHMYTCLTSYCDIIPTVRGSGVITGEGEKGGGHCRFLTNYLITTAATPNMKSRKM